MPLPSLLFERLLAPVEGSGEREEPFVPSLAVLRRFDEPLWRSVCAVRSLDEPGFAALLEAEADSESSSSDEDEDGEGREGGGDEAAARELFVQRAVSEALVGASRWQFESVRRGFSATVPPSWLRALRVDASDLRSMVCGDDVAGAGEAGADDGDGDGVGGGGGTGVGGAGDGSGGRGERPDFRFRDVFRVEADAELEQCAPLRDALWRVLDGTSTATFSHAEAEASGVGGEPLRAAFDAAARRRFLAFATGVDRLPARRSEFLKVEMPFIAVGQDEHEQLVRMLPQVCFLRGHCCCCCCCCASPPPRGRALTP